MGARNNGRARGSHSCLLRASVLSACYAGYKSVTRNPGLYESVLNHLNFPLEISLRKNLGWIYLRHTRIAVAFDRNFFFFFFQRYIKKNPTGVCHGFTYISTMIHPLCRLLWLRDQFATTLTDCIVTSMPS